MHNPINLANSLSPNSNLPLTNSSSQSFNLNQINKTNPNRFHSQLHSLSQSRKTQLNTNLRMFPRKHLGRLVKQPMQNDADSQAALTSEPLQHPNEDIDADGEADIDNDEPAAKRPRLSSPEPPKDTDMDDEAVLALAAHNGSTDFASDFATYGEA
ncbi:hypothetical protein LB503_005457 [Fusarium chuoi]|nr:hypothetical protein LB503_005457 [Fusarium chuoi]